MSEFRLTRYERARIIGARALQISLGAPVLIDVGRGEPIDIAMMELEKGVIPITVKRTVKGLASPSKKDEEHRLIKK